MKLRNIGIITVLIYTGISIVTSGTFFAITLSGDYDWVTRIGGSVWVFALSMIISMPLVTSLMKKRFAGL